MNASHEITRRAFIEMAGKEEITQLEHCDKYYISHWSPGLDLYILATTIKVVLTQKGAY